VFGRWNGEGELSSREVKIGRLCLGADVAYRVRVEDEKMSVCGQREVGRKEMMNGKEV